MLLAKLASLALASALLSAPLHAQTAPPTDLATHQRLAQQYLAQRQPAKAIPELQAVLALDPTNLDARANLGVLLFFEGHLDAALPLLRTVVATRPDLWKLQSLLGIAERKTGDDHQGRLDLEAAFPHLDEPKLKSQVGLELIESYSATAELDKASNLIAQLLLTDPTNPALLYTAYRIHADMMAQDLLTLSLSAPDSAQLHQAIAHELQRTHDLAGTISNLRQALALNPNLPGIHFELAEALHASEDQRLRTEAVEQYKLAVLTNPTDPKAATRLGDIQVENGDLDAAEKNYQQALKLQPNSPDAEIGMANVLTERGNPAAAAPLLEQLLAADPSNYLAHFRLSAVYRKLHRPDDVKRELAAYSKYKDMHEKLTAIYKIQDPKIQDPKIQDPKTPDLKPQASPNKAPGK
jgi:tetratricopeptide (TPR) repeat protein